MNYEDIIGELKLYKFGENLVISRPKFGSRQLDSIHKDYLLQYLSKDFRYNGFSTYQYSLAKNLLVSTRLEETIFTEYKKHLDNTGTKLEKLERQKILEPVFDTGDDLKFLINHLEETVDAFNKVVDGTFTGKVIFVYRNPIEAMISGICQEVFTDMAKFYEMIAKSNVIFHLIDKEYLNLISEDIREYIPLKLETDQHIMSFYGPNHFSKQPNFKKFFELFVQVHVKKSGLNGSHKGLYLSYFYDKIKNYNNLIFVNLDNKKRSIDFHEFINESFDLNLTKSTNTGPRPPEERETNTFYKKYLYEILESNISLKTTINNFLITEIIVYETILKEKNNV